MSQARLSLYNRFRTLSEQAHGHIRIEDRPDPVSGGRSSHPWDRRCARRLERPVPAPERVLSFTSLHRGGGRAELSDHDEGEASPDPTQPGGGRSDFPRGAVAGDCLHEVLERIDLSASPDGWRGVIGRRLAESAYPLDWAPVLSEWISEVLATSLGYWRRRFLSGLAPTERFPPAPAPFQTVRSPPRPSDQAFSIASIASRR